MTFVRAFPNGHADYLRAFFVDDECNYISSVLLAGSNREIIELGAKKVLEAAVVAGATGIILARGVSPLTTGLSPEERNKANEVSCLVKLVDIFLLDYIIVDQPEAKGLYSLDSRDRYERS